jgi:hypothetical protein
MSAVGKKRMDKLIPLAIEVIQQESKFFVHEKVNGQSVRTNKIPKTFNGYYSSFGADMANSTPLAAIIFYEQEDSGSEQERPLIPKSILKLLRKELGDQVFTQNWDKLSQYYMHSSHTDAQKANHISAAAAALKIALRTFPKAS